MEWKAAVVRELEQLANGYRAWPSGGGLEKWSAKADTFARTITTPAGSVRWLIDARNHSDMVIPVSDECLTQVCQAAGVNLEAIYQKVMATSSGASAWCRSKGMALCQAAHWWGLDSIFTKEVMVQS